MSKKISLIIIILLGILMLIANASICSHEIYSYCFFENYDKSFLVPSLFVLISIFVASIFALFISDESFKRWIKFSFFWLMVDVIFVVNSPVNPSSGYMKGGPETKEDSSRWMGFFFVFSSLAMFIVSKMDNTPLWRKWVYGILIFIVEVVSIFMLT